MIVRMQHLDLVCVAAARTATLERLRELGAVHLDLANASGAGVGAAKGEAADAERAVRLILKARGKQKAVEVRPHAVSEVLALEEDRQRLTEECARLECELRQYAPYGDFDPELAARLLREVEGLRDVVDLPDPLPKLRLSRLREKYERVANRLAVDTARLAGCDEREILKRYPAMADRIAFESAKALMTESGAVAVVSGWIPEPQVGAFEAAARAAGWGWLLRAPAAGEAPPTLVRPPRLFAPMTSLFEGLGIMPGYDEADVSVPFMCYFSLFFAMLVGDGAYGLVFLAATLAMRRRLPHSWLILLTVFSSATVVWGVLSNTWFGAGLPWLAGLPTVAWLADPSYHNMMFLCFTIGVTHLVLARVWNGLCALNDSTCVAQFGWAGIVAFMYCVTNAVIGIFPSIPTAMYVVFGLSLVAVFGFTVKPSELKARGAELGMLPLNIMSALGDVISYVRLFAVGLASVKVAENFNGMATGLFTGADGWALKAVMAVVMVAILVLGHALNLAMAGLSILVHAVRLNTLEFANHKGVTWAGYRFRPFRRGC